MIRELYMIGMFGGVLCVARVCPSCSYLILLVALLCSSLSLYASLLIFLLLHFYKKSLI